MQEALILSPPAVPRAFRALERMLDRLVRPTITLGGRPWRSFHLVGLIGIAAGIIHIGALLFLRGLPAWPALPLMVFTAIAAFLGSAIGESFLCRREQLTYYHHLLAIFIAIPLTLRLFGLPLLPYLDAAIVGIGTTLVFCRIGCTMAGCCHGRPHRWGVRYGDAHVGRGFPRALAHARLVPIQLIEASAVAVIVISSSLLFVGGAPFGATIANYLILYSVARMWIETGRGDSKRKFAAGLSEAQWTSMGIAALVVAAELTDLLPASRWHPAIAAGSTLALLAWQRATAARRSLLANPRHAHELASIIDDVARSAETNEIDPVIAGTGIRVSGAAVAAGGAGTIYTLSRVQGALTDAEAAAFARFAQLLRHPGENAEIVPGTMGTHVLFRRPRVARLRQRPWSIPPTHAAQRPPQEIPLQFPNGNVGVKP
jgi:hypothetical protein